MDIQTEVQKIHHQYGVSEKANYEIQLMCERYAKEAIDTVVAELEKPTYTPADMEEFSYWYHRKVSVIGESELHLFGVRPFEDIISFWKKEKEQRND